MQWDGCHYNNDMHACVKSPLAEPASKFNHVLPIEPDIVVIGTTIIIFGLRLQKRLSVLP